jgi:hypothetical protein
MQKTMAQWAFRLPASLKAKAHKKALKEGENLSMVIRKLLMKYVEGEKNAGK